MKEEKRWEENRCSEETLAQTTGGAAPCQIGYVSWMPGPAGNVATWHRLEGTPFWPPAEMYGCYQIGCGYVTDHNSYFALGRICPKCGCNLARIPNPQIEQING